MVLSCAVRFPSLRFLRSVPLPYLLPFRPVSMPSVPLWYLAFLRFPFDRTFRITGATFVLITFVPLPFVRFPLGFFRLAFALASSFGQCECTFKTEHQIFYSALKSFLQH